MSTETPFFVGWLRRPRGRWLPVAWSYDPAEAGRQLHEHAQHFNHSDSMVLPEGERPDTGTKTGA